MPTKVLLKNRFRLFASYIKILIFSILTFSFFQIQAQQQNTIFHHISEGLSQNTVTSFTQDEYGFLWIGTHYGLNRFDGANFKIFECDFKDSSSLRSNVIDCLLADKMGKVWVGTYGGGLNRYDIHRNEFERFLGKK